MKPPFPTERPVPNNSFGLGETGVKYQPPYSLYFALLRHNKVINLAKIHFALSVVVPSSWVSMVSFLNQNLQTCHLLPIFLQLSYLLCNSS